jgi:outer membrane protein assembly factor BamB
MFDKKYLITGLTALSITLTACGGGKTSMFRGDPSHTAVAAESGPTTLDRLDWKYTAPDKTYASPMVANGMIYLGCNDKHLYAIDQKTGQMKWRYQTGGNIEATPATANNIVYVGSWDKNLYAIKDDTRALVWSIETKGPVSSSPIIADGVIGQSNFA